MTMEDVNFFRLRSHFAEFVIFLKFIFFRQLILMIPLYDVYEVNHYFSGFALTFSSGNFFFQKKMKNNFR